MQWAGDYSALLLVSFNFKFASELPDTHRLSCHTHNTHTPHANVNKAQAGLKVSSFISSDLWKAPYLTVTWGRRWGWTDIGRENKNSYFSATFDLKSNEFGSHG